MLTLIPPDYRTLGPLRPDTTSPPFFLVWLKVSVNSVPSRRSCTRLSSWPAYCNIVWLLLMSLLFRRSQGCPSTIWLVTWTANCHLTGCAEVVGLKSSLAPVSVSSALDVSRPSWSKSTATYSSSLACFSNLQWDEFRDLISLPLFTVIILPFTPITEKGRGSNAGVRTSTLLCFKRSTIIGFPGRSVSCPPTLSSASF